MDEKTSLQDRPLKVDPLVYKSIFLGEDVEDQQGMCGNECSCVYLGFAHQDPDSLLEPAWGGRSFGYVLYRWTFALYFTAILAMCLVTNTEGAKWLLWLSSIFFIMVTFGALLNAFCVTGHYCRCRHHPDLVEEKLDFVKEIPTSCKIMWILHNCNVVAAPLITFLYWSAIYQGVEIDIVNATIHMVCAGYMVLELSVSGIPLRILHFFHPVIFACLYFIFTIVYWAAGGTSSKGLTYIYTFIDYQDDLGNSLMIVVVIIFLVVPFVFSFCWSFDKGKEFIAIKCCRTGRLV